MNLIQSRRQLSRLFLVMLLACFTGVDALAHRGHGCWTEMTWSEDRFEIIHRLHLSDAIAVLSALEPGTAIDSLRGRARLALYLESKFSITPTETSTASVTTIGAEIEDDFLLVYQEWVTDRPATLPVIENRALLELEPEAEHWLRYSVTPDEVIERRITPSDAGSD